MTDQKHTPEPWQVGRGYDERGYPTFEIMGLPRGDEERDVANAMRAQACVNALAGLNPEGVGELVDAIEWLCHTCAGVSKSGEAVSDEEHRDAQKAARAALARIRGEE